MFTHLRVESLKAVADSGELKIAPLTFLMGPNSSGKSTLIQSLLIARQTVDSRDVQNPIVVDGDYAALGSYREFVHGHEKGRNLCLEFGITTSDRLRRTDLIQSTEITIRAEFSYNQKTLQIYPVQVSYRTDENDGYVVTKKRLTAKDSQIEITWRGMIVNRFRMATTTKFYDLSRTGYMSPMRIAAMRRALDEPVPDRTFEVAARLPTLFLLEFEGQFNRTFYVGPPPHKPEKDVPSFWGNAAGCRSSRRIDLRYPLGV